MSKPAEPLQRQVMTTVICDIMDRDVAETPFAPTMAATRFWMRIKQL